jgi:class 3 adenylate cyclase
MTEERRLAAIMFSDICGFSKVMGENEEQALSFVSMHKDCIKDGTDIHGGRIIKEMGDGLLIEFASAVNAVRCAVAVQRAVLRHNNTVTTEPISQPARAGDANNSRDVRPTGGLLAKWQPRDESRFA